MEMDAVILAAGAGKRMKSAGIPKALFLLGGKPMICYAIDALRSCGVNRIFIVKYYSDKFDVIDEMYKDTGLSISYIDDRERKGSLYSFSLLKSHVTGPFICLDCDLFIIPRYFENMARIGIEKLESYSLDGVVACVKNPSKEDANMLLIENGYVKRFIKDGNSLCKRGGYIFIWNHSIFDNIDSFFAKNCYSLSQYYDAFAQNHEVGIMEIEDIWDVDNEADVSFTKSYIERAIS